MGFLDVLKSIGHIVPVVGPVIDAVDGYGKPDSGPSTASQVAQTAGGIEKQRMDGLIAQAKLQQEQDQLGLNRTNAGVNVGNLDLAQKKFSMGAPGALANQSVRGDILANSQDATVSGLPSYIHVGNISGGLRPSMLSASSRALGGQMSRNALADSTSGKFTNMPDLPRVPPVTPLPSANGFDKVLQGTAIGGSFLDALKGLGGGGTDAGSPQHAVEDTRPQAMSVGDPGMDPELAAWLQSQQEGVG